MPTDFATEYQALRHKVEQEIQCLEAKVKGNEEDYQIGQALYHQEASLYKDSDLQNKLSSARTLADTARQELRQIGHSQDHEQAFVDNTNLFVRQATDAVMACRRDYMQNLSRDTKRGLIIAFWQDMLDKLQDTDDLEVMQDCLNNFQQHLENIDHIGYEELGSVNINTYNNIIANADPNEIDNDIKHVLQNRYDIDNLMYKIERISSQLDESLHSAHIWKARITGCIKEYDDEFFYDVKEDVDSLQLSLQNHPPANAIHQFSVNQIGHSIDMGALDN